MVIKIIEIVEVKGIWLVC